MSKVLKHIILGAAVIGLSTTLTSCANTGQPMPVATTVVSPAPAHKPVMRKRYRHKTMKRSHQKTTSDTSSNTASDASSTDQSSTNQSTTSDTSNRGSY